MCFEPVNSRRLAVTPLLPLLSGAFGRGYVDASHSVWVVWKSAWLALLVSAVVRCVDILLGALCDAEVTAYEVVGCGFTLAVGWLCTLGLRKCGSRKRGVSRKEVVRR